MSSDRSHRADGSAEPPAAEPGEPDACAVAHGTSPVGTAGRALVAVFASPVAEHLVTMGEAAGFRVTVVEPDAARRPASGPVAAHVTPTVAAALTAAGADADVVVTDHHRAELGELLRDALAGSTRWIGVLGNPRHPGPHREALAALGVDPADIDRVHRPVGLNIGSRAPGEIAIATLAGLIADRNGRPGGVDFS